MIMNKVNLILVTLLISIVGCNKPTTITKSEDYQKYLAGSNIILTSTDEIDFWKERLSETPEDNISLLKLAGLFASKFKSTGDVSFIKKSDSLYHVVLNKPVGDKASVHQALAINAISQHKFKDAQNHIKDAIAIGDHMATSKLILTDVEMELGGDDWAGKILESFTNKNSFAWLIRKAKLKDHEGDLDSAIILMEQAYERIKGNKTLSIWALTNLGDMYGHDGRLEEAYKNYLKVLDLDPNDDYSLKGIAWIALSNDHKLNEAKALINVLSDRKRMPEAHLMLAEIASLENDESERIHQLQLFKAMVDNADYRLMYYKYLATIEASDFKNPQRCIAIAEEEINNRPTPQSYDLLAWGYYKDGDNQRALQVVNDHVFERTFEPESLYHMGMIYRSNGFLKEGNEMLQEALESSFEVGPSVSKSIQEALN
jgi:tetratricopeptide (TPR) repeat protein